MLVAGAMFGAGTTAPPSPDISKPQPVAVAAQKPATGEGPWLASCQYWASARRSKPSGKGKSPEFHVTFDETGTKVVSQIIASKESENDSDGDGWGIPVPEPGHEPGHEHDHEPAIPAIVATAP